MYQWYRHSQSQLYELFAPSDAGKEIFIAKIFASKAATLKEKRLLIGEQPLEKIPKNMESSPYETIVERLTKLLKVFEVIRVA